MLASAAGQTERPSNATWPRLWQIAAFLAMTAVIAGAFGAHALKSRLEPAELATFETAVRYQMYHALGLFAVCWILHERPSRWASSSGLCMVLGVTLFSGSLYALALSGIKKFGAITPLGGLLFLIGWILLAVGPYKNS